MAELAAPTCVGLAFTNSTTLVLVLRNDYSVKPFPSEDWGKWIKRAAKGNPVVAIVEDPEHFEQALTSGARHVIVLARLEWLTHRGIPCLDAEEADGLPVVKKLSPEKLMQALRERAPYQPSTSDQWLKRGDASGKCAGCGLMDIAPCKGKKHPESARCEKYKVGGAAANRYNLYQLVHLALRHVNEDALMMSPKEVWQTTYDFAVGRVPKADWIANCGRKLRTAGTNKQRLRQIVEWVAANGKALAAGKVKNPPGKMDIKLAQKRLAAKGATS